MFGVGLCGHQDEQDAVSESSGEKLAHRAHYLAHVMQQGLGAQINKDQCCVPRFLVVRL